MQQVQAESDGPILCQGFTLLDVVCALALQNKSEIGPLTD